MTTEQAGACVSSLGIIHNVISMMSYPVQLMRLIHQMVQVYTAYET